MADVIVTHFMTIASLNIVATAAVGIGAAALLVWCGFRLAAKLTNRGVGK